MQEADVITVIIEALWVILKVSAPAMATALLVGLAISLFQALTQIQEMTLTFVPKIVAIFFVLMATMPFMFAVLIEFMELIADRIVTLGG
ncbi:MAG: flagellar biosynthetic protein FliQ [Alphaproteobacteria bacterium]